MPRMMDAEIVGDTAQVEPIVERLTELGFTIEEIIDWPRDDGLTACSTIIAAMLTELETEEDFFHHVEAIVDPFGAFVMEAGLTWRPSLVRGAGVVKRSPGRY
jgi:hypothetical protein